MKNIFLLFGAHDGAVVSKLDKLDTDLVYNKKDIIWDEIHAFEPNTYHSSSLSQLQQRDPRVTYHNVAVSIENTTSPFYVKGSIGYDSSTLDKDKHTGALHSVIDVNTIDIIEWISANTNENDFIVIDMDIECEEYHILPKLMQSEIADRIKFISIEFHANKSHYWSKNKLDVQIYNDTVNYFGNRLLGHNKYFG